MMKPKKEEARGILNKGAGENHFQLSRYEPSDELAYLVEHYWIVRWDLRGKEPYQQEVLAHPSVHLVFEKENTRIWGVVTSKFTRTLEKRGHVVGIKFKPGAFFPFCRNSVDSFADDVLPFDLVFDDNIEDLEKAILLADSVDAIKRTEEFLLKHLPAFDPKVAEIGQIMDFIKGDPLIVRVDDLVDHFSYSKRTLQRLFKLYVGVSPKWVIQRYRLHNVAEKIAEKPVTNWAKMALDAGYFDQAHFIRDFKAIVGKSPVEYAEALKRK